MNKKNSDTSATNIPSKKTNKMSDHKPPPCSNTCHYLTPQNMMISLASTSPPLHSPGRTYSLTMSEDDARIIMMPFLPPPLDEDERNRKNCTTTHHHLKVRTRIDPKGQCPFFTEYSYSSKVATDPSNMNTMILRKNERNYSGNESTTDFSIQLFRPIHL